MSSTAAFKSKVRAHENSLTLIDYLSRRFQYHSREKWLENISHGELAINGERAKSEDVLTVGDTVSYTTQRRAEPKVPKKIPVLLEDEDLLIVNKPAHIPVHPGGKYLKNTLIEVLRAQKRYELLVLAHRLDRETSGACVLTKSHMAKEKMYWAFFNGEVKKTYLALCWGTPPEKSGIVDIPIGQATKAGEESKSRIRIKQIAHGFGSKIAKTHYQLLETFWIEGEDLEPPAWPGIERARAENPEKEGLWPVSLIECHPITGRTNQIRVHMSEIGCGIVGDKLYDVSEEIFLKMTEQKPILQGEKRNAGPAINAQLRRRLLLDSQALHAYGLEFRHPRTGKNLRIRAPLPPSWFKILPELEKALH
jgi:23S rRNA-/tRNA-specific pseudouridylate synthase